LPKSCPEIQACVAQPVEAVQFALESLDVALPIRQPFKGGTETVNKGVTHYRERAVPVARSSAKSTLGMRPQGQTPDNGTSAYCRGAQPSALGTSERTASKAGHQTFLVACFWLASSALLQWVEGTLWEHDLRLLQKLLSGFQRGDVVLADRGSVLLPVWRRCWRAPSMRSCG
jgi:hypothetical protein